jgi:hypothetical protein
MQNTNKLSKQSTHSMSTASMTSDQSSRSKDHINVRLNNLKKDIETYHMIDSKAKDVSIKINENILNDDKHTTVYLGTGLCTTKEQSIGIPFDFFGYMAMTEATRRAINADGIVHLIADTHAKSNDFTDDNEIDILAERAKIIALNIAQDLSSASSYDVIKASDLEKNPEYNAIYQEYSDKDEHEYVKRQWTDMQYMEKHQGTRVKISWLIDPKKKKGFDERYFDEGYQKNTETNMSFIYTKPGLTATPSKIRACPYTATSDEDRVIINRSEDVKGKVDSYAQSTSKTTRKIIQHLEGIVSDYEKLRGRNLNGDSLASKMNAMIDIATQGLDDQQHLLQIEKKRFKPTFN